MKNPIPRLFRRSCALLLLALAGLPAARAATLTGAVRNEAAVGLSNVDLDFIDVCTGDNIFLVGDKTAADGTFSVVVPAGLYDVHFTPPAGSVVYAADQQDVNVTVNASLGIITLHPGRLVSGAVRTPSSTPAAGVDLKFVNVATDERVYLSKDVTSSTGQYSVRVPPGTWNIDFRPPATTSYTDAERLGLVVAGSDISGLVNNLGSGFLISGSIRDKQNNLIKNVNIDVFDVCTGRRIPTAHDNSDVNGNYLVCVPAGTYTFNYDPPRCLALEAARTVGYTVDRDRNLGTEQLKDAVLVMGTVLDHTGAPLPNAKLKFYDVTAAGAPRQATTNDHTDANGAFAVYVLASTWDINIEPPAGLLEQVGHLNGVVVAANVNVGTVQLQAGVAVSGHVVGPGNVPARNVNINAVNSVTRVAQRLAHDDTDAAGNFTVVMAPGTYDFQYDPPGCSGLAPASQNSMTVGGPTTLPTLNAVVGVHALGTVLDGGSLPVANADLDFYVAGTATKIYTPNDQTALDGSYDVLVPPGTYDVKYIPSSLTRLRPDQQLNVSLPSNQTLPITTLVNGWLVSGLVRDSVSLAALGGVTVEFYVPGTLNPVWTAHHMTDSFGAYNVSIDAGTWDLLYTPPAGSAYGPAWRRGVVVSGDVPLGDQLLDQSLTGVPLPDEGNGGGLSLAVPWPNPARGQLNLSFAAPPGQAELSAWDVCGRRVATLWNGTSESPVTLQWDFTREDGQPLTAGVYYLRLSGRAGASETRRVVLVH